MAPETITVELSEQAKPAEHQAFLCVVLESARPLVLPSRHLLAGLRMVLLGRSASGERAVEHLRDAETPTLSVSIPDRSMSAEHARLERFLEGWVIEDCNSKNGTFVNGRQIEHAELKDGDVIEMGQSFLVFRRGPALQPDSAPPDSRRSFLPATLSTAFELRLQALEKVARKTVPVMLCGETGTGKEVVARAVHSVSGRPGPFVAVNCAAIPASLVASELFGYRKGAFSGANEDRPGLVRTADRGTLFLDEIGDLPLEMQAALLRVLQEREVLPLGASKPISVDLRIIAATHRDLPAMARKGEFREDLLARLSGFTLQLPPLRDRREDLGMLVPILLQRQLQDGAAQVSFGLQAARTLLLHPWPLNVRQLERMLEVATALADDGRIEASHLSAELLDTPPDDSGPEEPGRSWTEAEQLQRDHLVEILRVKQGNIAAAARELGKARTQVQRWIKRFRIDVLQFRR